MKQVVLGRRPIIGAKLVYFLVLLFVWVLILRSPTFLVSAFDWDEGLYVLIASQWLNGHPPYTTILEIKPIGIFTIFAAAMGTLGESMISIRVVTIAVVYLTSVVLLVIAHRLLRSNAGGVVASISYPALTLGLQGLSSNTELFYIFFNVLGLYFLIVSTSNLELTRRNALLYGLAAGLSFGAAVQIKYVVAVEIALFVVYFLLARYRSIRYAPSIFLMLAVGGVLPSVCAIGYLWARDALGLYLASNFGAYEQYLAIRRSQDIWTGLKHGLEDWVKWSWVTVAAIAFLRFGTRREPQVASIVPFVLFWFLAAFAESSITLRFFKHYYLVTIPPLCVLLAYASTRFQVASGNRAALILAVVVAIGFPVVRTIQKSYIPVISAYLKEGDANVNIARYIKEQISPQDYIYVVNQGPTIYFLTRARLPTRYVFPLYILDEPTSRLGNIDYPSEVERIFSKSPRAVVIRDGDDDNARVNDIRERLRHEYAVGRRIADTLVYIRKPLTSMASKDELISW
jgi:4-amino-4-deoxy-L-arabinose transferase-like glycosyltransferase